jgi:hypothetical protein
MKMLMLTLPFMVRDLITPKVLHYMHVLVCTRMYCVDLCMYLQDVLGFPDKADQRAEPSTGWTPAELNHILHEHVVDGALTTFGCAENSGMGVSAVQGVMRARCYPFNLPKKRFHSFNPQVGCTLNNFEIIPGTY